MNKIVSAFLFVLMSLILTADKSGALFNCCTQSIHVRHAPIGGHGMTSSEICKDGHRLPNRAGRENESCGVAVNCGLITCDCPGGCRQNSKNNCDDEALRLFLENEGKKLGIEAAEIQYEKGSNPRKCGPQSP